ncbi:DUF222 domain-containing protein [Gordonia sp. X0973]|uniref:DUF222 domain-containing protein n=1 Tax=Gordonia sp. X0973 TaxID=2742602 RepID=UPI0015839FFB|nr:DUF222 domain-containing protein [Gordonia sp. X0973]QKT06769.1 DUF222 domain-containing protein [Gordonia sp. X0973]
MSTTGRVGLVDGLPDSPVELVALADAVAVKLGSAVWAGLTEDELVSTARLLQRSRWRIEGVDAQLFTEINDRCAFTREGFTHPLRWLSTGLRLGRFEARRRYRRAAKIARLTSPTGQTMEPEFPATAAAVAAGLIGGAHVDEIGIIMGKIPWRLPPEVRARAEADLAEMATELTPFQLRAAGSALLAYLDPDGTLSDERDRTRRRRLSLGPQGPDLMSKLTGDLPPIVRAKLELFLTNWAAPGMNNPADGPDCRVEGALADRDLSDDAVKDTVAQARARDDRNPEQRNLDAFEALLDYVLADDPTAKTTRTGDDTAQNPAADRAAAGRGARCAANSSSPRRSRI